MSGFRTAPRAYAVATALALGSFTAYATSAPQAGDQAGNPDFDQAAALSVSQAAIGREVGDHRFIDHRGRQLKLSQLRGRPALISLIYTSCYHTCPVLTNHLARMVNVAREALGADSFRVLTIGFDAAVDTPPRMAAFARERRVNLANWYFLSADAATIEALSRDLGFIFFRSPKGFDHLAQTTVLDAQGRVHAQLYGETFEAPLLVEPLKQLVFGTRAQASTLAGWIDGVRLFCTIYDPSSGRYRFDYSLFIAIGVGVISLGGVAVFIIRAWRQGGPPASAA